MTKGTASMPAWRGWGPIFVLPAAVLALRSVEWPHWLFMWVLSYTIFFGCKWLTWRRTTAPDVPWWRHAGYLLAWPGLDARAFLSAVTIPTRDQPAGREWRFAAIKLLSGVFIFWGAGRLVPVDCQVLLGWCGMTGMIFMLHFGSFHLLSCAWRTIGVDARPLMNYPLKSTSVSEFWGRRWNTAFRDLTHRFLFRPLTEKLGPRLAVIAGFLFSGLVHDLVISVPAGGGYGGPTLFFAFQAAALLIERSRFGQAHGLGRLWRGRVWTMAVIVFPAYGLFHPPFVREVVVPFMRFCGAA
jgi:Membrane bound O-acyl transferase family